VRVAGGRVDISGNLVVTPLYKGADEDSIIEFAEFELPFSGSIDVTAAREGNFGDVNLIVLDSIVTINPDENGEDRIFALEAIVGADICISDNQELVILEDAYCIDQNLDINKAQLSYQQLVCRNKNQFNVKEVVTLDGAPEILQILTADGTAYLEDKKVIDDKVVVEGIVTANILYIANSDTTPLYNHQAVLPIRQVIEARGARLGMDANVEQTIDHIGFNMLSGNEVELRFVLSADALVQEDVAADYISDITFSPISNEEVDSMPSMVVLYVQKGDSLWGIAKKYNASLEELAAINDIDSAAELKPGQKLLVVKKVAGDE
jgi:LysM repeat protein